MPGSCEHVTVSESTIYPRLFSLWGFVGFGFFFFSSMHACLRCLLSAIFNVLTGLKVTTKPMQAGKEKKQKQKCQEGADSNFALLRQ